MISQTVPENFARADVTKFILIPDSTNHLTPALSPNFVGGEGGVLAVFPKNPGLTWLCGRLQTNSFSVPCPLPGERKQVRANVSTNFAFH